ncbi:MAG: DNA repair protein RecO [Desulfosudaceae bacterium]
MPGHNISAIILRRLAYSDYDFILDFLTDRGGKVSAIAKNARKSKKRFAGILEPFSCLEVVFVRPRKNAAGMFFLKEAFLTDPFAGIRNNYEKMVYASYWSEIINRWVEAESRQAGLFPLFYHVLSALAADDADCETLSLLFQIRFMALAGMSPDLSCCGVCRQGIEENCHGSNHEIVFDVSRGGLVCPGCRSTVIGSHQVEISRGTIKQLLWMQAGALQKAGRLRFTGAARRQGLAVMEQFVPYHLAAPIKSLEVLQNIRQWRRVKP